MQIKVTMRYHSKPMTMMIIFLKKKKEIHVSDDVEKPEPLYIAGGNAKW